MSGSGADSGHVFIGSGGMFGESNFFIAEDNWPRGRGWYESLFDGADRAAAIGECSLCYTWAHVYRGVPERMAQVVPEARLVYVVRDPIARMQAIYMHQVSAGRERRRAEVALLDDRYLGPSLYGFQLAAFLDHFDRSQVLVIASWKRCFASALRADQARNARGEPHHLSGGRREPETRTIEGAAACGTEQRIKLCAFHGERESMRESAPIVVTLGECLDGPRTRTCRGFLW
jgi:hypothetical protein